jgi:hypothetical protein
MTTQPAASTTESAAANAAELTPAAAWSRRVRRIGGFIQTAFAAFWLARASLAVGDPAARPLNVRFTGQRKAGGSIPPPTTGFAV